MPADKGYLQTGQTTCHGTDGTEIPCAGSGQDAEFSRGIAWSHPRFERAGDLVLDRLTGLFWPPDASLAEFPLTWQESLDFIKTMNTEAAFGYADWRLPNRRELRSLLSSQTARPALPHGHPFINVFDGWYWTSTTAVINPAHAWYVNMAGARMFYGGKDQSFMVWPVRGKGSGVLPLTGQGKCYDDCKLIPCKGTGQDGDTQCGGRWPEPRFAQRDAVVVDCLSGLAWRRSANLTGAPATWAEAIAAVAQLERGQWRLPNINELESLVDCNAHTPALPRGHGFLDVQDVYWSSTTSLYEPDWAWALYLDKGAVGVGHKPFARFYVWAVCDCEDRE